MITPDNMARETVAKIKDLTSDIEGWALRHQGAARGWHPHPRRMTQKDAVTRKITRTDG